MEIRVVCISCAVKSLNEIKEKHVEKAENFLSLMVNFVSRFDDANRFKKSKFEKLMSRKSQKTVHEMHEILWLFPTENFQK